MEAINDAKCSSPLSDEECPDDPGVNRVFGAGLAQLLLRLSRQHGICSRLTLYFLAVSTQRRREKNLRITLGAVRRAVPTRAEKSGGPGRAPGRPSSGTTRTIHGVTPPPIAADKKSTHHRKPSSAVVVVKQH